MTAFTAVLLISVITLTAQPSGGPYGPVRQSWPLPQTGGRIFFVAPDGSREASGETVANPTTIEAAIEKVITGDVIIMRSGRIKIFTTTG